MSLASLLAQKQLEGLKSPLIVVLSEEAQVEALIQDCKFFSPEFSSCVLPAFDVSPYSNLYPNSKIISQRLNWLYNANHRSTQLVFFASVEGLMQRTLPYSHLVENTFTLEVGGEFNSNTLSRLNELGYYQTPVVEDRGTFSIKGGIVDIYSPANDQPFRLELFGDQIEEIKFYDPDSQLTSQKNISRVAVIPAREVLFNEEGRIHVVRKYKELVGKSPSNVDIEETIQALAQGRLFHGIDFLLPLFYENLELPIDHFSEPIELWLCQPQDLATHFDRFVSDLKKEFETINEDYYLKVDYNKFYPKLEDLYQHLPDDSRQYHFENILIRDSIEDSRGLDSLEFPTYSLSEFRNNCKERSRDREALYLYISQKLNGWRAQGYSFFVASSQGHQRDKLKNLLAHCNYQTIEVEDNDRNWSQWTEAQHQQNDFIHVVPQTLLHSYRLGEEKLIFFRDDDFFGHRKTSQKSRSSADDKKAFQLDFSDLNTGDLVVHKQHGVGVFEGLKVMEIGGFPAEFVQLSYKDKDKLYLPIYRIHQIQKYSGPQSMRIVDKLGGTSWEKTKKKAKKHLRDIAAELLKLYAHRAQAERPPFSFPDDDFVNFENSFPFEETEDQAKAITDVITDMTGNKPMDRLVCGDVGFGKTEVALRAAFKCAEDSKQVCVIAPTTILTFQHYQNFLKRMSPWPITVKALNRFVPRSDIKNTLSGLKDGSVDIVIGTHRLLSKDVEFKNLGLLIIDEEQKFGVKHKEKIRKIKASVDTLTMSATPIPRTLNMSLMGMRDLSLINTAPVDRLPTRTFICKFDKETIRKAVQSEVQRGGQVFFLHNRVQSIDNLASELRELLPEVRFAVGHGQMDEEQLEKTMVSFFNKEVDVLICTTIIESGMDVPNANTMFIDNAHQLGLSQLYQLRGRVGRGKERAYCYLIVPANKKLDKEAQERLRVIQENTALGSGIRIAQHDLELRGAGDILGEEQSGQINAVGYEMYMELLENTLQELRGEPLLEDEVDPEINLRIPALIPDDYIADIRIRLNYYKTLSQIETERDLDRLEEEIHDQYGKLPEPLVNLMGLMLIKNLCKTLKVKDLTQSRVGISMTFKDNTPLSVEKILKLCQRANKKFSLTPDSQLVIRIKEVTWPRVYEELQELVSIAT